MNSGKSVTVMHLHTDVCAVLVIFFVFVLTSSMRCLMGNVSFRLFLAYKVCGIKTKKKKDLTVLQFICLWLCSSFTPFKFVHVKSEIQIYNKSRYEWTLCKMRLFQSVYSCLCASLGLCKASVSLLISFPYACLSWCVRVCSFIWRSESEIKHSLEKYSSRAEQKKTCLRFI